MRNIYVRQRAIAPDRYVWQRAPGVPYQIADNQLIVISPTDRSDQNTGNVKPDTVKQEPVQQNTDNQETVQQNTDNQEPVKQEPVKQEPVKQEPVKPEPVKQDTLLLKEIDETNNWARLAFQLYFGWFALQFTINALAISWIFTPRVSMPPFANSVFLTFIGWNLMGTIGTLLVHKGLLTCDQRIREVTENLDQHDVTGAPEVRPRSPMPRQAINQIFALCAITVFMSLVFWIIFLIQQMGL